MHSTHTKQIDAIIWKEGRDILGSKRFQRARQTPHHKTSNVAGHSFAVAQYAVHLFLNGNYPGTDIRDVVRACLLHDIGMTDPDVHDSISFLKAYSHPKRSAEIAAHEFHANEVQVRAIERHMWPICVIPPDSPAGWLLLKADKHCSREEAIQYFFKKRKGLFHEQKNTDL